MSAKPSGGGTMTSGGGTMASGGGAMASGKKYFKDCLSKIAGSRQISSDFR